MERYIAMKKLFVFTLLLIIGGSRLATAQESGFGAGVFLGEPLGLTVKQWLSPDTAIDGGIGYSFRGDERAQVHGDYLWHKFNLFPYPFDKSPLYFGGGLRLKFADGYRFGFRVPVGVSFPIHNQPLDVFAEVAPILDVAPGLRFDFNLGVGVRMWF